MAGGRPLEQVVTQKKAVLKAPGLVKRTATDIDRKILDAVFRLPRPASGEASRDKVVLANGDVAVVVSTEVQDGDWAAAPEADRARQAARMRESQAGAEFAAYRADLEKRIEIEIHKQPDAPASPAP
jgi:peptidyl-prolyl cis-trans isomerase D